jgi:GT2 family glycosyltransferase
LSQPSSPRRRLGSRRPADRWRQLIHQLNQRYRQEFDRAERFRAELADIHGSRAWRLLAWLRRLKRLFPSDRPSSTPLAPAASPLRLCTPVLRSDRRVSIIIPFKDRVELLRGCLKSLRASTHRRFEVILVDNGSTEPRTLRYLERFQGRRTWRVVACPGTFNFSRLCNAGALHARGDDLLFLNNDTEVLDADWLEQMLAVTGAPQVGVVGATLLYPDGTIQHAGIYPQSDGTWTHVYRGCAPDQAGEHGELRQVRTVPAVTAACLLISRQRFMELGGFDERFPTTFNDVDLCQRIRQRGLLVAVTPHARLLHYESLSRGYSAATAGPGPSSPPPPPARAGQSHGGRQDARRR